MKITITQFKRLIKCFYNDALKINNIFLKDDLQFEKIFKKFLKRWEKVNLDDEFEKFKDRFLDKFLDTHNFDNELESAWRTEQDERGLIDISNEDF